MVRISHESRLGSRLRTADPRAITPAFDPDRPWPDADFWKNSRKFSHSSRNLIRCEIRMESPDRLRYCSQPESDGLKQDDPVLTTRLEIAHKSDYCPRGKSPA